MENLIITFFKRFRYLHLKDLITLYEISTLQKFRAGDFIAKAGEVFPHIVAIRQGIVRTYILKSEGEACTVRLAKEGDFTTCANSFILNKPSTEYLQAVEDCSVIFVDSKQLKSLSKENIRLLRLWNDGSMDALLEAIQRVEFFASMTPEERYLKLLKENPDLLNRVPQKYLASYIGVTTVSYSRIKSRITQKMQSGD